MPESFLQQVAFDLREIDEIIQIVHSFKATPDPASLERLRYLPRGNEMPDADSDSRTRDFQYELLIRAILRDGGLKATMSEPDVRVRFGKHQLAIEAKRPRNEARFDDRLRKAVIQLRKCRFKGVVAISMDHVLRPRGKILSGPSQDLMVVQLSNLLVRFVEDHGREIQRRVADSNLVALIFTARMPSMVTTTGQLPILTAVHRLRRSSRPSLAALCQSYHQGFARWGVRAHLTGG